jgi:hypothetical protein
MADRAQWTGSASDLLEAGINRSGWPKSPRALAGRLRRAQTFLRTFGIEIFFGREGRLGTRTITITAVGETQPRSCALSVFARGTERVAYTRMMVSKLTIIARAFRRARKVVRPPPRVDLVPSRPLAKTASIDTTSRDRDFWNPVYPGSARERTTLAQSSIVFTPSAGPASLRRRSSVHRVAP